MFEEQQRAQQQMADQARAGIPDDETALRLADLSALRIVLTGESVVDGVRLWFKSRSAVDEYLRLTGFDTDNPMDMQRLTELHQEAVAYLTDVQHYRLPTEVQEPNELHDLLTLASFGPKKIRRAACMTLKVMHIAQHVTGRELAFNTPVSEAELLDRLNAKVFALIDRMRASGVGIKEFAAGKKARASLISKLLSKRNTLATHIFDRLRFRIIVNSRDDLVRAILHMVHHLFPFNYVVPEQSINGILSEEDLARVLELPLELVQPNFRAPALPTATKSSKNEFSGETYRSISFVVDIPLRIDDLAPNASPAIAFVQAEVQLVDVETERSNNAGENAHPRYKERQQAKVRRRLESVDEANGLPDDDD